MNVRKVITVVLAMIFMIAAVAQAEEIFAGIANAVDGTFSDSDSLKNREILKNRYRYAQCARRNINNS